MTRSPSVAAATALALLAIFGVPGIGWRAWLQRRRTGSFGIHGVSGRIGSLEWIAGVGFVVAMTVAGLGPLLQFVNVNRAPAPDLLRDRVPTDCVSSLAVWDTAAMPDRARFPAMVRTATGF
jgi:hypothetical protein